MKTILISGGTGYLGSWVVKYLLEESYTVRLTVRDKSKQHKYKLLQDIASDSDGTLEIWEANLLLPGSYDDAAKGADTIIHMASPFSLRIKDPQKELIDPALKGTENILSAANKSKTVKRVVLTSSVAAIYGDALDMQEQGIDTFTESHWNNSSSLSHQPYSYSKTLAEKKAWEMANSQNQWTLAVINPAFVLGPSLSKTSDSESLVFIKNIIDGKFRTGAPKLYFGFVDVRDVAKAHIAAAENLQVEGRHILCNESASMMEMVEIIEKLYPKKYKLPLMTAPKLLMQLMGPMFGVTKKFVKRNVGYPLQFDNSKSIQSLGINYYPLENTLQDMIEKM